ncbi:MAG: hypothetical protein LBQ95_01610 [Lachnospiraceae bacterium]|jgi:O-antigen/teichoic acid export membrane protein|nr:hypothetical protein [Lachnospiraceae bacterium]
MTAIENDPFSNLVKTKQRKKIISDFVFTIGAAVLMNCVLQLIVYPIITKYYGESTTGDILYFIGIIYIVPQAIGSSIGNQRLIIRRDVEVTNGNYEKILMLGCSFSSIICFIISLISAQSIIFSICYGMFSVIYMLRIYSQVEFRLSLNFSKFFIFSAVCSIGYLIGLGIYFLFRQWIVIFLCGELAALIYVGNIGSIFKRQHININTPKILWYVLLVLLTTFIRDGVNQFDRVIIRQLIGAEVVTRYNAISLIAKTLQLLVSPITTIIYSYLTLKDSMLLKSTYNKILAASVSLGGLFYLGTIIGTPIFVKMFYFDFYEYVQEYNLIVNLGLIIGFVASMLMAVLLSRGKIKENTILQTVWGVSYTISAYCFTISYGLWGLVAVTLVANVLKLVSVILVSYGTLFKDERKVEVSINA